MTVAPLEGAPNLQEVAKKRGWQTLLVSLGVDVLVAFALFIMLNLGSIGSWSDFLAPAMTLAVTKSVIQAIAQWIIRRFIDQSGFNPDGTPKPAVVTTPEEL